jgi:membrane protein implicated in regulation of membrane protease activity
MTTPRDVVDQVSFYWLEAGVPKPDVADMRAELELHLIAAERDGRGPDQVVGDRARFAHQWAEARVGHKVADWEAVHSGRTRRERETRRDNILYGFAMTALVAAAAAAGQGGETVDNETWRWLWTIFALVMGLGEMFTAGFFLLPFAIGAASAALLAWFNVSIIAQWLVFFGVSAFSFAYLRKYVRRQDEAEQPLVGANRWIGQEGVVLEGIEPVSGRGMVRILNEEWRASALGPIEAGTKIVVSGVKGTRLIVEELQ